MRTGIIFTILTITVLGAFGCEIGAKAGPAVAVVDTSRVFRESAPGKAGIKYLEGLHESMQAELNNLQKSIESKPDDAALQQKVQESYMSFQQRMGAEQQNVINQLNDIIQKALDTCREQKKLDIVFGSEAALSFSKTSDITADVIAEVNKRQVEFKPITPEEPKAKPAIDKNATTPAADQNAAKPAVNQNATKPAVNQNATKTNN